MQRIVLYFCILLGVTAARLTAAEPLPPTGLMTDLLEWTDKVWLDGLPTQMTLEDLSDTVERAQIAEIRSMSPSFSWIVNDRENGVLQTAYEIEVSSTSDFTDEANVFWKSGKIESADSSSILTQLPPLAPETIYYWRVRTWNNQVLSPWSVPKGFKTASRLYGTGEQEEILSSTDGPVSRYPVVLESSMPVGARALSSKKTFYDFGRDAFGYLTIVISNPIARHFSSQTNPERFATVRLGERVKDGEIDRDPPGSTRFREYRLNLFPGTHTYRIKNMPDKRNTAKGAVKVPDYIGELLPFRYTEIEFSDPETSTVEISRYTANYPFDDSGAFFHSDSEELNRVWDLCRYSMKATSFAGIFVDGDRERIPYEGDALLNQLGYYSVNREYSLARLTEDYLIFHPTWPTEWILQSVCMAWYDWLWTGDKRFIERRYEELKAKSLLALAGEDELISTTEKDQTPEFLESIHFHSGKIRDIVDWPHKGLAGNENANSGETDGFDFKDKNVVVNAYHYFALTALACFAEILDKENEAEEYRNRLRLFREQFQNSFFDTEREIFVDGKGSEHASLHGNMFPLAFGLVPEENRASVTDFVRSRGMKCSVYGSQFLLDAIYEGNGGEDGFRYMTETGLRGWLNMLRVGSTISLEAWDDRYKPNQDWNHAWGAAPANIIPRRLVGIEPTSPGYATLRIKPQIASLQQVEAVVPTIRGSVAVSIQRTPDSFEMKTVTPANTQAEIWIPFPNREKQLLCDGKTLSTTIKDGFALIPNVGSGEHVFKY